MFEKLTECEELTMKVVWDAGEELSLMEITQRVNDKYHKQWKPQTVSTFLAHLVQKGYLRHYRQGRTFLYQILVPLETYRVQITNGFYKFWYYDSGSERQDIKVALKTLIRVCESHSTCAACPLYDPDESETACMLAKTNKDCFAENARAALENIVKVSISQ